jgi:hypothetical protein
LSAITVSTLTVLILAAALLYASVGHGGASGYLAAMALLGIAPVVMKPTALSLNILVAAIATIKFYRARRFSWAIFWPFALGSIPFSFVGGSLTLAAYLYKPVVGVVLLYAGYWLLRTAQTNTAGDIKTVPLPLGIALGGGIGLLSGLTGVGGGIFLSPLLMLMGWAETRQTPGITAPFILVNSIAGLAGHLSNVAVLPGALPIWAAAAAVGGYIGAEYGSKRFSSSTLKRLLAIVLFVAGFKMIFL